VKGTGLFAKMGACMSSPNSEEVEQKKKSRVIDAQLEEDSKRLRKECKILLLGKVTTTSHPIR
jgi:guanine nucleotide-binding protein G(i) subunit alpha